MKRSAAGADVDARVDTDVDADEAGEVDGKVEEDVFSILMETAYRISATLIDYP
ncbi:hypothetical protein GCM10007387_41150 [Pseudoduganella albidiflava]|uniref:Uncharacterized protein n=2 Tax=Pseudoduganella albidiflava TaxID=321983 RepID=A0AA87XUY9_9BURK|nr:hypothetical protein GCM10007387_41150 [Pseudoduganella albidiflava]